MRLGRLRIHIALSNANGDVKNPRSGVRVIVLPSSVYPYFDIEQVEIRKAL